MQRAPSLVHLLHRASQTADEAFSRALGDAANVTPRQAAVLACVAEREDCSQSDVVQVTGIDRSTVADMARRLVGHGWLTRKRSRSDARAYVLKLTPAGQAVLGRASGAIEVAGAELLDKLPARNQQAAIDILLALTRSGSADT